MPHSIKAGPYSATGDVVFPTATTPRRFEARDVVFVDTGMHYEGYQSDYGHTWVVGWDLEDHHRRHAQQWLDIVAAVVEVTKPGATARDLTRAGVPHLAVDTYPPNREAAEAIGFHKNRVSLCTLIGGILGGTGGYSLMYWISVIDYPINVGGKPFHSWPAFIPVLFECTVLGASLATLVGMLLLNGLPQPYHPVFNVPRFALASRDRFFLCVEATDPKFDAAETPLFLGNLGPRAVVEVPH